MKKVFVLLTCFLIIGFATAQPGGGGGGPGGGAPVPLPGIGILVAAGALLGIGAFFKSRKSEKGSTGI